MRSLPIAIRFSLIAPISARWVPLAATADVTGQGQTNSQWNTMGDEAGWLTTSKDMGATAPGEGERTEVPPPRH